MSINDYPAKLTDDYYYVRTAWEDEESQVGQYRTLKSAIARADANPGTHIFTGDGIAIYPEDEETVTVSEGTEEITLDEPEATQDNQIQAKTEDSEEVLLPEPEHLIQRILAHLRRTPSRPQRRLRKPRPRHWRRANIPMMAARRPSSMPRRTRS